MDINEITNEEDLGDIFVTAMNLKPEERIKMQKAWQINIDASISSTINLPYEAPFLKSERLCSVQTHTAEWYGRLPERHDRFLKDLLLVSDKCCR